MNRCWTLTGGIVVLLSTTVMAKNTCQMPCGSTQFCATSDVCMDFTCQNFYQYGPEEYVGYNSSSNPPALACEPYTADLSKGPWGVVWGCVGYINGQVQANEAVAFPMNWYCTSKPSEFSLFECYSFQGSTDFSSFLYEVNTSSITCQNVTKSPSFIYEVSFSRFEPIINGGVHGTNGSTIIQGADSKFFQENLTHLSMYASLKTGIQTESPSMVPSPVPLPTLAPRSAATALLFPIWQSAAMSIVLALIGAIAIFD